MRKTYHPDIQGFEFAPEGKLLSTVIDMKGQMGIAYGRSINYSREIYHAHDRFSLSFPRGACLAEIQAKSPQGEEKLYRIDSSKFLSIPKNYEHNHRGKSLIYDTVALYPTESLLSGTAERMLLKKSQLKDFLENCQSIRRTAFLNELVERYFTERVLKSPSNPQFRNSLEGQILDEVLRLFFGESKLPQRKPAQEERQNITERAIQFIEANLFAAISSKDIANYARTSVASLFRVFKKDVSRTPFDYIRERRLDEALQLIKGKQYSVSDVALLVGYEDLSAFSKAFKKKFRKNASNFLKK